jgi:hypothetical protein
MDECKKAGAVYFKDLGQDGVFPYVQEIEDPRIGEYQ